MNRLLCLVCLGVLIVVAIAIGIVVWTGATQPVEFLVQQDPPGRNDTLLWPAASSGSNNGLYLIIENALDDSWTPYLEQWVSRWDAGYGSVDPLALSIQRVAVDSECTPSEGRIKVCNGNYGQTDWRGINVALTNGQYMVNSVAMLNDYWLHEEDQKQYTMCHELGHGFGLAHTDEIYTNINTGECMDYTNRPGRNLDPGAFNFDLLQSIYGFAGRNGSVENVLNNNLRTIAPTNTQWTTEQSFQGETEYQDRFLRRRVSDGATIPASIREKYNQAIHQINSMTCTHCLIDLTDGYRMEVHRLLAF
ncbi:hypothetical protein FisN_24Lh045 [Fistulifera solaris]|uniref:Peptidase M10 metallopeptidase domain-containing protein n=1 Tax=Fistulifera solaris TaxID=1519565 RepID=A0A1Z5KTP4_FISSO|nr:hypothetical protein FisN_24Lh045 [Fistulifera solaris]|eukprot:GAX29587.1 hypothetical protein FisN_24Lh045 [Fistulifera solaris]